MGLNASKVKGTGGTKQAVLPAGNYPARVVQVIDLGLQARKAWKGTEKPPCSQLNVTYELPNEFIIDADGNEDKEKPRWVSERMNLFSLSQENAISTKRINALDPANALEGDWSQVVGAPCAVTLTVSKCGKYNNIGSVSPLMKGVELAELSQDGKVFDLDSPDLEMFNSFPQFIQDAIKSNLEFNGSTLATLLGGGAAKEEVVQEEADDDAPY